ncbi:MAG: hypothetical protein AAF195_04315, partial [Pseudomonadota bacterium]
GNGTFPNGTKTKLLYKKNDSCSRDYYNNIEELPACNEVMVQQLKDRPNAACSLFLNMGFIAANINNQKSRESMSEWLNFDNVKKLMKQKHDLPLCVYDPELAKTEGYMVRVLKGDDRKKFINDLQRLLKKSTPIDLEPLHSLTKSIKDVFTGYDDNGITTKELSRSNYVQTKRCGRCFSLGC